MRIPGNNEDFHYCSKQKDPLPLLWRRCEKQNSHCGTGVVESHVGNLGFSICCKSAAHCSSSLEDCCIGMYGNICFAKLTEGGIENWKSEEGNDVKMEGSILTQQEQGRDDLVLPRN